MRDISVHALWLAQDDPKKNTAVLASKRGDIKLHKKIRTIPKKGIILEPLCGKIFGPEDHHIVTDLNGSLVGLDCSWKQIESSVSTVMKQTRLKTKNDITIVIGSDPVNWGKPGKLTTMEAVAASLHLVGNIEQSKQVLGAFRWGERFFELNHEPLMEYSGA